MANGNSELSEKDFIHEEYGRNPFPFWGWLIAVLGFSLLFSLALSKYTAVLSDQYADSPFLRVTNREISLFLWQNPNHMRAHVKSKNGYLPAFQYAEKIGLNPEYADDYVQAPPELLFLYHTWHRLLSDEFPIRAISAEEFQVFLEDVEEWQPRYWNQAPKEYVHLTEDLGSYGKKNLNLLPAEILPIRVRQAFIGWKNYFYEGDKINEMVVAENELEKFIKQYPHYARNYWRNIAGDSYLKTFTLKGPAEPVLSEQIAPFLRVALFNEQKGEK